MATLIDTGSSQGCKDQLNAQIQAIDARLKQTEKSVTTLAKGLASLANGSFSPSFDNIGLAFKAMAQLEADAFAAAYMEIVALIDQFDPSKFMTSLLLQAAMRELGSLTAPLSMITNMIDSLNQQYTTALQTLSDPLATVENIAGAKAVLQDVQLLFDTSTGFLAAVNNMSQCKSSALHLS